jgi:hypothetical protein
MGIRDTTPIERDAARLEEALPWYLNGTLAEADRAWVEQMLAADSEAAGDCRDQFEFDRRLAEAFEQKVAQVPADIGWSSLIRRVRADAAAAGPIEQGAAGAGGSGMRRLPRLVAPVMTPRMGMAMAVLLAAQAIAIGVLRNKRQAREAATVEYRSGGRARPVPAIRARLNDSITEKVLREALLANGAGIVEGPNRLGEYRIVTGDRDPGLVAGALRAAGVIASYVIDQRQQRR